METKNLVCIQCPLGCPITVTLNGNSVVKIEGHTCKRGLIYAEKEITAPTRTVTSTVLAIGGSRPVVSVKTASDIPKDKIFSCMQEINRARVIAPVKIGDIIIPDVCGTGVAVVATANLGL